MKYLLKQLIYPAVVLFVVWTLALNVGPTSNISINDLPIYESYAQQLDQGRTPYSDIALEYPPVALLPIKLGNLFGLSNYESVFSYLMLICAFAVLLLVGALAGPAARTAGFIFALSPLLTGALIRTHFDLLPLALLLGALLLFVRLRPLAGGLVLGLGTMAKFFPALLLPLAALWQWGRGRRREVKLTIAAFALAVAVVSAPFLGKGYIDAFSFHLERPVQVESTAASLMLIAGGGDLTGTATHPDRFRSQGLSGELSEVLGLFFAELLVFVLAGLCFLAYRMHRASDLILLAFAAVLAFMALGKVLSPQFMVWLTPFIALGWVYGLRLVSGLCGLAILLTQIEFPSHYWELVAREPGVIALVAARNGLLLAALTLLVVQLVRRDRLSRRAVVPTLG